MELIDKDKLLKELKKLKQNLSASPIVVIEDVESLVKSFEVKEENNLENLFQALPDKVEPKFHVDEWVVTDKNDVVQIKAVNNGYYTIDNGMDFNMPYIDRYWHKWNLQDAKNGDVLVDRYGNIGIFEKTFGFDWYSYCYLGCNGDFMYNEIGGSHDSIDTYPATKEQRDTLFQKMHEAGYKWSAEMKELMKIEDICMYSTDNYTDEERKTLCEGCNISCKYNPTAWSEEDDAYTLFAISAVEDYYDGKNPLQKVLVDWLKSLKQRKTWKPSDMQMASITCAVRKMKESACYDSELVSLLNDLKKLREE